MLWRHAVYTGRKYDTPSGEWTSTRDRPAGGDTGRLFLTFGGPVCADRNSICPLDRVLTYKNLIYLLNLQFYVDYFWFSGKEMESSSSEGSGGEDPLVTHKPRRTRLKVCIRKLVSSAFGKKKKEIYFMIMQLHKSTQAEIKQ